MTMTTTQGFKSLAKVAINKAIMASGFSVVCWMAKALEESKAEFLAVPITSNSEEAQNLYSNPKCTML